MRRDFAYLLVILLVAFGVRVYAPWQPVLGGSHVNYLETDAWYHIRLIENQVKNWPWRVTMDPYAAPGGQFVPIAPFFDTMTATAVLVAHGRDATVSQIERLAALVPPVLGTLAVAAVWALALVVFDRRAALLSAALLAILPGHFLDRTQLGFYDHHALEALLSITTLCGFAVAYGMPTSLRPGSLAGLSLGLYLLGWSSGAFFVGILGAWLVVLVLLASSSEALARATRVAAVAALVALVMVMVFQDRRMFRYESQVLGLVALAAIAGVAHVAAVRLSASAAGRAVAYAGIGTVLAITVGLLWAFSTGLLAQLITDVARLSADPKRMGVLEARPLFLYNGVWNWAQPWEFFRTGFYVGLVALVLFTARVLRERQPIDLLIWVTTAAMFVATYGQNRFGYYLVPMCALLGGWLATVVLDWGAAGTASTRSGRRRRSLPFRRETAALAVAAGMFAPNIVPSALASSRPGSLPDYWNDALVWVRDHTDPPFSSAAGTGDDYYYARYPATSPPPDYSVMNWWDHGYWIVQIARRVPVANPTQERALNAARFYAATREQDALATLAAERARYAISDWELPFRYTDQGAIMGRFQNVIDWAGARHDEYYEVMFRRAGDWWMPVWVFHEPYYRSMAFRLSVLGGAAAVPSNATAVIVVGERVDSRGMRFREIVSERTYATYDAAVAAARLSVRNGRALVVGLDPWRPAFPVEGLTRIREVHAARTAEQVPTESPWVRVFQVLR